MSLSEIAVSAVNMEEIGKAIAMNRFYLPRLVILIASAESNLTNVSDVYWEENPAWRIHYLPSSIAKPLCRMDASRLPISKDQSSRTVAGRSYRWHTSLAGIILGVALTAVILIQGDFVSAQSEVVVQPRRTSRLQVPDFSAGSQRDQTDAIPMPQIIPGVLARRTPASQPAPANSTAADLAQPGTGEPKILPIVVKQTNPPSPAQGREPTAADDKINATDKLLVKPLSLADENVQRPTVVPPAPVFTPVPAPQLPTENAVPLVPNQPTNPTIQKQNPPPVAQQHRYAVSGAHPGVSRFRANNEADAQVWISPYQNRARKTASNPMDIGVLPVTQLDHSYTAWWDLPVRESTGMAPNVVPVTLEGLVQKAMLFSPQVLAVKTEPHVQYHVVGQEEARFDWAVFLETTFDDFKDPVGNTLTLGVPGLDRLKDRHYSANTGLRRRNQHGGEFEMSQRAGHQRQNSSFFSPNPQESSRLELQYRQPFLNGAGAIVNQSQIVLARIAANSSEDEVVGELQEHLVQVTEACWALYRARAEFFQRQKLLQSSEGVLRKITGRNEVDTIPRQILRARAAVAKAQSGIQRTLSRVRDAEAEIRLLVNSPELLNTGTIELIPQLSPTMVNDSTELRRSLDSALQNRPDISEAIRQMRASGVRMGVSRNELLPRLDFIVSSYVSAITGNSFSDTVNGQFGDARPSYSVGLEFEVPLGNRAARSRLEQRKWKLKRSINVFRATVEKALTDVEIAHREVATTRSEVLSRHHAMSAAQNEASYLQDRFDVLPMAEDSATLLLEDLLDVFERVADGESAFVQAQVAHAIAIILLRKEVGTLLRTHENRPQLDAAQSQWISKRVESRTTVGTGDRKTEAPQPAVRHQPVSQSRRP